MAKPLPSRVRADLFAQLAAMEKAGLPADRAWSLLKVSQVPMARLQAVQQTLARGGNPASAAQNAGLFTPLEGNLVRAALAAGSPAQAYQRLADTCAQKAHNEGAIRSRMVLPFATLVLALFIQPVPQWVAGTLSTGAYLAQVLRPLAVLAVLGLLAMRMVASPYASRWLLRLPVLGPAIARRNARDFFESLALLLEAGVPMFEALPHAVATIIHTPMRKAYSGIKTRMQRGAPLSQALADQITDPLYLGSPQVISFVHTGESSGTLPEMLFRHVAAETESLNQFWQQVAQWLPRIAYAAVAAWMAYGLLTGGGFGPRLPPGL
ncbi:MAG: type II secretion system F family protein [Pseudomonadota bacterium]